MDGMKPPASSPERGAGGTEHRCVKRPHVGSGYLHAEDDDSPYEVDGVLYCGRCHMACDATGRCASVVPTGDAPPTDDDVVPTTGYCRLSPALLRAITEPRERDLSVRACTALMNADLRSLKAVRVFLSEKPDGLLLVKNCGERIAAFIKSRVAMPTGDAPPEKCPFCGNQTMHALRFEDRTRIRTYTCLHPPCGSYRKLIDEDDGDHGRGDCD